MAYENEGSLFRNKDRKSDYQPTHWGSGKIGDTPVKLSAWPDKQVPSTLSVKVSYDLSLVKGPPDANGIPTYSGYFNGIQVTGSVDKVQKDSKTLKAGEPYLRLKFTPPPTGQQTPDPFTEPEQEGPGTADEIPF